MSDRPSLLAELLDAWRYAREGFIDEAANLSAEAWRFRPTAENRDVAGLARHVVESSLMAVGEVSRPDGDFTRQSFQEHIREHAGHLPDQADRDRWLELLRESLEAGIARMREVGDDGILRPIRQFNGEPASRLTWFHHNIAHEEYHRGQLTLYARLTDATPALTKRIRGE
jgi:uncharacterized damage-inducible protein DinB